MLPRYMCLLFTVLQLRPHPELAAEAARFVAGLGVEKRFIALHWRHGDWVDYELLVKPQSVVRQVNRAQMKLGCPSCVVFLMTNCRNASAMAELAELVPTLVSYVPWNERFAEEGPRLVIEQTIAAQAAEFVGSPRSAVTQFIESMRSHPFYLEH